jgi:hypothetical protein
VSLTPSAWHELVLEGPERAARGFVAGFLAGRGVHGGGVFGSDVGLAAESLGERVRELLAAGRHHVFFAPEPLAGALADAVDAHGHEVGVRVESRRALASASFTFHAEAFDRDSAARIRGALLASPPPSARVEDLEEKEETHADERGVELYAPAHAYTYRVSGRIVGALPAVLELRRRAVTTDFVKVGALSVTAAPSG